MGRKNGIATKKIQVSVDKTTDHILELMVPLGFRGKNKSEVASQIIRDWIWHNQDKLKNSGIAIKPPNKRR